MSRRNQLIVVGLALAGSMAIAGAILWRFLTPKSVISVLGLIFLSSAYIWIRFLLPRLKSPAQHTRESMSRFAIFASTRGMLHLFSGGAGILIGLFPTRLQLPFFAAGLVTCGFGIYWLYLAKRSGGAWWPRGEGKPPRRSTRRSRLMALGWLAVSSVCAVLVYWWLPRDPLRLFLVCLFFVSAVATWIVALIGIRRLAPRSGAASEPTPAFVDQYANFVSTLGTLSMFAGGSAILLGVFAAAENFLLSVCGLYACAFGSYWLYLANRWMGGGQAKINEETVERRL